MESNQKSKLMLSIQLINVFIGIIITIIFGIIYINIESKENRIGFLSLLVIAGVISLVYLYTSMHKENIEDSDIIGTIELINEDNEVVKKWIVKDKISFLIGKNNKENDVFVDLNSSIYSSLIEDNHAVLNYAVGKWYIEDLSVDSRVCIQKIEDGKKYRVVKNTPCSVKKGDIIFISKVKLLLK